MQKIIGASFLALMLAGCGGGGSGTSTPTASDPTPPSTQQTTLNACVSKANPADFTKQFGSLKESSTVWNAAGAKDYSVCLNNTLVNNNITDLEMVWNVTPTDPPSSTPVIMYPNLQFGWQTGFSSSTTTVLPAPVSNIPSLPVAGTVTTTCNGQCSYDTSFDLFFSNTSTPTTWPPAAEMMIYLSNTWGSNLPGTNLGTVTIDGIAFTAIQNTAQNNSSTSWPSIIYVVKNQPLTNLAGLNIKDFVQDALSRGVINSTQYLDMVEIGTEVLSGSGTTSIKNYSIGTTP